MLIDSTQVALQRAIEGAAARNTALAANLANAETPGYQRVDVDFHSVLAQAMDSGDPDATLSRVSFAATPDGSGSVRADGSTVDVDAESAKLAANGLEHQTAVQLAAARLDILRSAMGVS